MPQIRSLDHLVLTVADLAGTAEFYTRVLGMSRQSFTGTDGTTREALSFGAQKINLHQAGAEFRPHATRPTAGSADLCFLTDTALTDWQAHLAAQGVAVEDGPIRRTGATGPILSLYLRDLDGNLIEISQPLALDPALDQGAATYK
ncbi:VOC family protein [Flavimaricola marinus]|uniref:Virulence protein n=1 Tax=Flavimaricola marinus TaxID=1819565 RepID=A0A238LFF9_9RHOB|nr:VOC family protein [Flavimaricola marinus]SMY08371.1 Virulence protein [Flavimaricola marinus]